MQTTVYKYHTSGINGFKYPPGFFISALHVFCQKGEDAAKAFFLGRQNTHQQPCHDFSCAHPGMTENASR